MRGRRRGSSNQGNVWRGFTPYERHGTSSRGYMADGMTIPVITKGGAMIGLRNIVKDMRNNLVKVIQDIIVNGRTNQQRDVLVM